MIDYSIQKIDKKLAAGLVVKHHYLHRKPPISYAFGLYEKDIIIGVLIVGTPPSRHLQISACKTNPSAVYELNRLWCEDEAPKNTESYFISKCLKMLPPMILVSYADTAQGHLGIVYRATNWNYAGVTDMDRKTPRYDYVVEGKHSRDAFRSGKYKRVRRKPKHRYWIITGNPKQKRELKKISTWPVMIWGQYDEK